MALVGMASKPLHVRRLQKALQEWVANPAAFETMKKFPTHVMSMTGTSPSHTMNSPNGLAADYKLTVTPPQSSTISTSTPWASNRGSPSDGSNNLELVGDDQSPSDSPQEELLTFPGDIFGAVMSSVHPPALLEHQISAIANAAGILARDLPPFEPKSMPKKQISKEIQAVMMMSHDDQLRMDALRKYAAIYGRFDSKRKNDKPMSLHEISVNEAAAQLCSHFPALLTRREELFPLARQVVRDSGYQYSKGHSRPAMCESVPENPAFLRAAEVLPITPKTEPRDSLSPSISTSGRGYAMSTSPSILPTSRGYTNVATASTSQKGGYTKSTSPSTPLRGYEKNLQDLQRELSEITLSLSELTKEQDRIRSALRVLLENNDHNQTRALTAEMDVLNDQQTVLTKRRQTLVTTITKFKKNSMKYSPSHSVSVSSPNSMLPATNQINPYTKPNVKNKFSNNKQSILENHRIGGSFLDQTNESLQTNLNMTGSTSKDSLYEEGLRIATQYGMADFAQELIGMKSLEKPVSPESVPTDRVATSERAVCKPTSVLASVSGSNSSIDSSNKTANSCRPTHQSQTNQVEDSLRLTPDNLSAVLGTVAEAAATAAKQVLEQEQRRNRSQKDVVDFVDNSPRCEVLSDIDSKSSMSQSGEVSMTQQHQGHDEGHEEDEVSKEQASGSTTSTTKIMTKTGLVEVETRRSSRKRNTDPDYYLINGGEKRFRNSGRRSSSTSSERAAKFSGPSHVGTSPNSGKLDDFINNVPNAETDLLSNLEPSDVYTSQGHNQDSVSSDKDVGRKKSKLFYNDIDRNCEGPTVINL